MRCIIVDDEPNAIDLLKTFVQKYCPTVEVVGDYDSVESAFKGIVKLKPDFIFLDIKIGDQTGFDLLDRFGEVDFDIIFTTAYSEYSLEAFDYGAVHYLTKPINIKKLESAVERLQANRSHADLKGIMAFRNMISKPQVHKIALPNRYGSEFIEISDIQYCEASGSYSVLHLMSGEEKVISKPLGYLEEQLSEHKFCRIHKKYLINTNEIVSIHKGKTATCILNSGNQLPLSASYKNNLQEHLKKRIVF